MAAESLRLTSQTLVFSRSKLARAVPDMVNATNLKGSGK